ncbi:hypothetical protein Agub_g11019 [Astrephomene gubernaculifera]|uniref:Guanylate cyclase domain-containing protein n=1 Tax=Astrephomene gubernaculifera TaxID=47775 RepID=A0AAD3DXQ8_9CHLO|nr:hypothetical protein Agub_g11019 [Astrephomene gubernaculifera]
MALFAAESSGPMAPHELSLSSSPAGAAYAAAALRDPFTRRSDTSRGGSQLHLGGGGGGGGSHREPFTLGGSLVRQFEGPLGRQLLAPEAPTPRLSQPLQHSPPQQPLSAEHSRQAVTAVQSGAPGGQQEQQGQGQQRQVQGQSQQQQQLNQQQQRSTGTWALSAAATVARHRASLRGRSLLRHSSIERTDSVSPRSTTTAQHNSSHQHHRSFAEIFRTLAFPRGSDVAPPAGRTRSSGNVSLGLGMLGTWVGSHTGRNLTGTPTSQHGSHTSHANSPGHSPSHHNPHHPQHHSSRLYARLYAHHHHNKHNQQPAHNQHNSHGPNHLRSGHQASADVEDSVDDVGSVRSAVGGVYASEKGSRSYTAARSNRSFVVPTPRIPSSPALPRVVAFASSLRHAPPPVQQLQQQMSLKRTSSRTSRVDSSHLDSRQLDSPTYIINMAMGAVVVGGGAGGGGQQGSRPDSAIASPTFTERQSGAVASGAMGTVVVTDERALQPSGGCAGPYMPMSRNSAGSGAVLPLSRQQLTSPAAGGGGGFQGSAPAVACGNAAGAADLRDAFLGAGAGQRLSVSGPAAAVASVATATGSDVVLSVAAGGQGEAEGSKAASTGVGGASDATVEVEAEEEVEGEGELEVECWQEVTATRTVDTATGQAVLLLTQVDVTAKVLAERHIARVSETEHRLLEEIFPRHVLAYMTEEGGPWAGHGGGSLHHRTAGWRPVVRDINKLATSHDEVTLLFADIQGFTPMCKILEPRVVMTFLNDLFTRFDRRLDEFGVYKVETIGDCYFVVGGLVQEDEDGMLTVREGGGRGDRQHAERVFMFAKAMLLAASQVTLPTTGCPVRMRIGIHSGPVVSGVVGQRMPRFCLFGDAVNTASRMESTGVAGCIHASDASWRLLSNEAWVPTGGIEVKGRGLMQTYLWAPPYADLPPESQAILQKCMQAATASGATMTSSAAATTSGAATNIAAGATAQQPMQRQGSRQEQGQQQQQRGRQAGWVDSVAACSQNGQDQVLLRNRSLVSTAAAAAAAAAASSTVASSIASCVGGGDGRSHGAAAAATAATATAVARMTAPATATSGSNVQDAAVDSCNTLAALLL